MNPHSETSPKTIMAIMDRLADLGVEPSNIPTDAFRAITDHKFVVVNLRRPDYTRTMISHPELSFASAWKDLFNDQLYPSRLE